MRPLHCLKLPLSRYSIWLAFLMLGPVLTAARTNPERCAVSSIESMEGQIRDRIEKTVTLVSPKYNKFVRSYLRVYLENAPDKTEYLLGRTEVYFPLFEKVLEEEGLPDDLKYLAIVESSLIADARSRSGAAGLWQFMKPTARAYGLRVSRYVDERLDPEKSTRAAVKYLKFLYQKFQNWELAMAAYNAGPGRVSSAIRRAGSNDYWTVSNFLPRETRAYVPGFIAVNYLLTHYQNHGLQPKSTDFNLLRSVPVLMHEGTSFQEINKITGVAHATLKQLNPVYTRHYIPASNHGHILHLPVEAVPVMLDHLGLHEEAARIIATLGLHDIRSLLKYEEQTTEYLYHVKKGDNLYTLAQNYHCTVADIMAWNGLHDSMLQIGQKLRFYIVERVLVPIPDLEAYAMRMTPLPGPELQPLLSPGQWRRISVKIPGKPQIRHLNGLPEHGFVEVQRRIPLQKTLNRAGYSMESVAPDAMLSPGRIILIDGDKASTAGFISPER